MRGFITEEVYIPGFRFAESSGPLAMSSVMMVATTMTRCSNLRLKLGRQFPLNLCTMFVPFGMFIQGFIKSGPKQI